MERAYFYGMMTGVQMILTIWVWGILCAICLAIGIACDANVIWPHF